MASRQAAGNASNIRNVVSLKAAMGMAVLLDMLRKQGSGASSAD